MYSIDIPAGYEIDEEVSTPDRVVLKRIYEDSAWRWAKSKDVTGFQFSLDGRINPYSYFCDNPDKYCMFSSEDLAKSARAAALISQILLHDKRFGGPVTREEWMDKELIKHIVVMMGNVVTNRTAFSEFTFLAFHTEEQRALFVRENKDLIRDFFMDQQAFIS